MPRLIGTIATSTAASGGIVTRAGAYIYHTFLSSGEFTVAPTRTIEKQYGSVFPPQAPSKETSSLSLNIEYLMIAGGGSGGGGLRGSGGGAGEIVSGSISPLTAGTYVVTIGAGGVGTTTSTQNGGNTTVAFPTPVTVNGGGAGALDDGRDGASGGSGGGGGYGHPGVRTAGSSVKLAGGYGNSGCVWGSGAYGAGGGAGTAAASGYPGDGKNTWAAWAAATNTGVNGYYAGGGAGASWDPTGRAGGLGGGGHGGSSSEWAYPDTFTPGTANTGSGGGGTSLRNGCNGGSGLVIIRYLTS